MKRGKAAPKQTTPAKSSSNKRKKSSSPPTSPVNSPPTKLRRGGSTPDVSSDKPAAVITRQRSSPRTKKEDATNSPSTSRTRSNKLIENNGESESASCGSPVSRRSSRQVKQISPLVKSASAPQNNVTPKKGGKKQDTGSITSSRQTTPSPSPTPEKSAKVSPVTRTSKRSRPSSSEEESPSPTSGNAKKKVTTKKASKKRKNTLEEKSPTLEPESNGSATNVRSSRRNKPVKPDENSAAANGSDDLDDDKTEKKLVPLITALDEEVITKHSITPESKLPESNALIKVPSPRVSPRKSSKRRLSNGNSDNNSSPEKIEIALKKSKQDFNNARTSPRKSLNRSPKVPKTTKSTDGATDKPIVNGSCPEEPECVKNLINGNVEESQVLDKENDVNTLNTEVLSKTVKDTVVNENLTPMELNDSISKVEEFLKGFDLSLQQITDVITYLPQEVKDSTQDISQSTVRDVVWCLLHNTTSLKLISFPRCNKLVRQLMDHYSGLEEPSTQDKMDLYEACVNWAKEKRRSALHHELQVSMMMFYASINQWKRAEKTATELYKTVKPLQDKEKIVKACLCLSRCFHAIGNLSKARGFITTAKTEALKIYTAPELQAQLDLQSGILQIAEGKDLETAVSYFKEAATGSPDSKARSLALKYLVLGYLLLDKPAEAHKTSLATCHVTDVDEGVVAMLAVADSAKSASVKKFRCAREKYKDHLEEDKVIKPVLDDIYSAMMEKNIKNIILPYKRVQIQHIADSLELPRKEVEKRLSQMILDGALSGQLDHRDHCLYLYPSESKDPTYTSAIETISHLEKTISHLSKRVKKLL